jgi:hypothetical protein
MYAPWHALQRPPAAPFPTLVPHLLPSLDAQVSRRPLPFDAVGVRASSRAYCVGGAGGGLVLMDPRTGGVQAKASLFAHALYDFDLCGTLVAAVGSSQPRRCACA